MKFRCCSCYKEWAIPKERLVYISDWPDECPYCESTNISRVIAEKATSYSRVLEDTTDEDLNKIRRKKFEIIF